MRLPDLYLMRHGETEWNRARRMQGWCDSPLTALGRTQARQQGAALAALGVADAEVWVSPLGRAVTTAELALPDRDPATFIRDDRLREIFVGQWQGMTRADIEAEAPAAFEGTGFLGWYDFAPGGEGFAGLEARCRAFLASLERPALVFTHGITSRMLRLIALGLDCRDLEAVPGGQGVIHVISDGAARVVGGEDPAAPSLP